MKFIQGFHLTKSITQKTKGYLLIIPGSFFLILGLIADFLRAREFNLGLIQISLIFFGFLSLVLGIYIKYVRDISYIDVLAWVKVWIARIIKRIDLVILILSFAIFLPFFLSSKPIRVGDGSEYYALSLAWKSTNKPFMTEASWAEYNQLYELQKIIRLNDVKFLKNIYSPLSLGSEKEFPHFSFYSFCAAIIAKVVSIFGIQIFIHHAFLIFHWLLFASMLIIARRCFGWEGLLAAFLLTFLSPISWYFDKVITEFFTYCVTVIAVIFFLKKRYLCSALFLSLASTQNISFAAISIFVIGIDFINRRKKNYSFFETILFMSTVGFSLINPIYYFSRYGVINPLLYMGGKIGENFRYLFIWLIDPDVGLFPNWPFGFVLLLISCVLIFKNKPNQSKVYRYLLFMGFYIFISLVAQSSTANLNSGGSPGISRYALWYLALFFPMLLYFLEKISTSKNIFINGTVVIFILLGSTISILFYKPTIDEYVAYINPSPISLFLQKNLPFIYNPPPEIFAERYSGVGESAGSINNAAIIGPDCHKILLMNQQDDPKKVILGGYLCNLDNNKVSEIITQNLQKGKWNYQKLPSYEILSDSELELAKIN